MNTSSPLMNDTPMLERGESRGMPFLRVFYWSLRRELWESPSIHIAPIVVACVFLFGGAIAAAHFGDQLANFLVLSPEAQDNALVHTCTSIALSVVFTSWLVAWFYCLDALYAERRDRSVLFWKSLPVSDIMTVASKFAVPLLVLPLTALIIGCITELIFLIFTSILLATHGAPFMHLWTQPRLAMHFINFAYGSLAMTLWYAPVYAWLLLVSAYAKFLPILWALLPPIALMIIEAVGLGSHHLFEAVGRRLVLGISQAFTSADHPKDMIDAIPIPLEYLTSPGLWIGLAVALLFLAGAVTLRRNREAL